MEELEPGIYYEVYIWWCGDYHCDCTQARIDVWRKDPRRRFKRQLRCLWEGEFHTGGEPVSDEDKKRLLDFAESARARGRKVLVQEGLDGKPVSRRFTF